MGTKTYKKYKVFTLIKDLNPVIKTGMKGVIIEKYNENQFEVEFLKPNGTNYEYNSQYTFTIDISYLE